MGALIERESLRQNGEIGKYQEGQWDIVRANVVNTIFQLAPQLNRVRSHPVVDHTSMRYRKSWASNRIEQSAPHANEASEDGYVGTHHFSMPGRLHEQL